MLRLLRVAEGDPPIILRFTGAPGDTPRDVLERAQVAIRKAMKGGLEVAAGGEESASADGGGGAGGSKGKGKDKGGKSAGYVIGFHVALDAVGFAAAICIPISNLCALSFTLRPGLKFVLPIRLFCDPRLQCNDAQL